MLFHELNIETQDMILQKYDKPELHKYHICTYIQYRSLKGIILYSVGDPSLNTKLKAQLMMTYLIEKKRTIIFDPDEDIFIKRILIWEPNNTMMIVKGSIRKIKSMYPTKQILIKYDANNTWYGFEKIYNTNDQIMYHKI